MWHMVTFIAYYVMNILIVVFITVYIQGVGFFFIING